MFLCLYFVLVHFVIVVSGIYEKGQFQIEFGLVRMNRASI